MNRPQENFQDKMSNVVVFVMSFVPGPNKKIDVNNKDGCLVFKLAHYDYFGQPCTYVYFITTNILINLILIWGRNKVVVVVVDQPFH